MGIETAIPCGLILNELVSNSLKHGFNNNETGLISVVLHKLNNGEYALNVSDNGAPFLNGLDVLSNDSLGLELIKNLVDQLDASLSFNKDNKEFKIIFKELIYKERM